MVAKVTIIHRAKFFHILGWLKESLSHVGSENLSRRPFLLPKSRSRVRLSRRIPF